MKKLLRFEMKKAWEGKRWILPLVLFAVILLWFVVSGFRPLRIVLDQTVRAVNQETRPYWGQTVSDEMKQTAREKALSYGARDVGGKLMLYPVYEKYGASSLEATLCTIWAGIASSPTLEEEKAQYQDSMEQLKKQYEMGIIGKKNYESHIHTGNLAVYQIAPAYSAWKYWLNPTGYAPILTGLGTLLVLLVFLCDIFSKEMAGSLYEVVLTKPRRRPWILSKILVSGLTGFIVAVALSLGLLVVYGVLYGFQGWNIGALSSVGLSGWCYGSLYLNVSCLSLSLIKLLYIGISGAALGMMIAAVSALVRQMQSAMLLSVGAILGMESLLYIETIFLLGRLGKKVLENINPNIMRALLMTPVRMFLNMEELTLSFPWLQSSFSPEIMYNCMLDGKMAGGYFLVIVIVCLLSTAVCFRFEKVRQ